MELEKPGHFGSFFGPWMALASQKELHICFTVDFQMHLNGPGLDGLLRSGPCVGRYNGRTKTVQGGS